MYIITMPSRASHYDSLGFLKKIEAVNSLDDPQSSAENNGFKINITGKQSHFDKFRGAYGCFMSHFLAWEDIVKDNNPLKDYYVFEDDANPVDIVRLHENPLKLEPEWGIVQLNRRRKVKHGSEAYAIKGYAAKKLVEFRGRVIECPVDKYLFRIYPRFMNGIIHTEHQVDLAEWGENSVLT